MAGPSVVIRVLGDLKGLGDSFKSAGSTASGAISKIHGAFSGLLGTINKTGVLGPFGDALSGIDEAIGNVLEHGKKIGVAMAGVGGALVGIGAGLQAVGSKDKAAHQQLQAAVEATGASYDDYEKQVESAIKTQEKYGTTADKTQDALRVLTQATHDPAKAFALLGETANIAASKHEDLATAADQVGKVYNGNTKLLKPYGIELDKTTGKTKDGKTALQALADVTKGQASAATDTFTGKLDAVKAKLEDTAASIGQKYGPAITAAGAVMAGLGAAIETATAINDAFAASEALSLGPILLVIAAIAALGVAAYLIYRNWNTIWAGMRAAVSAVFNWIKTNWPLLLAIILGPIGIAAAAVIKNWDAIKNAAVAAFRWVQQNWPLLLAILTGPIGVAVLLIQRNFDAIVSFAAALPGRIGGAVAGAFDAIWNEFRGVINRIIGGWNSLHFSIPSIDTHIPGVGKIGGESVGVPHIPMLAQGGLITSDGLIYAHAGEAITPAPQAGRQGPAVVVQNANFSTDLDVESFMRKAAWLVRTQTPCSSCVRRAWLTLGALSVDLDNEAGGWFCSSLDLGFPDVRDVVNNRPDRDGVDDRTSLMGGRVISADITALRGAGAQIDAVASSFAPFMVPSMRPTLHYILDRPGAAERTFRIRASAYAWPVAGPDQRDINLQWLADDPVARDPNTKTVTSWSGSSTGSGRAYPLTFNRIYPAGGGGPVFGIINSPGDVPIRPLYRIYGPITGPYFYTSAAIWSPPPVVMFLSSFVLGAGQWVDVDSANKTAYLNSDPTRSAATSIDWQRTVWPVIPPQTNVTLSLYGSSTSGVTQIQAIWHDGYLT